MVEDGPFSQEELFASFADDVVLFAHITSRVDGRENDDLLERFGKNAFPTLLVLDAAGDLLGEHTAIGARNVRSFRATVEDALVVREARDEPVGDHLPRTAALLAAEIELGLRDAASASERFADLRELGELPAPLRARLDGLTARLEFDEFLAGLRQRRGKPEDVRARVLELIEAVRIPTGRGASQFWMQGAMASALALRDRPLAERALEALEADPWFENEPHDFLGTFRERIATLPEKEPR